jgi:hypothetical protein
VVEGNTVVRWVWRVQGAIEEERKAALEAVQERQWGDTDEEDDRVRKKMNNHVFSLTPGPSCDNRTQC